MKLVKSVKVTEKFVEVRYDEHRDETVDEFSLKMKDPPHPDLVAALAALVPCVIEIIEQPTSFLNGLKVRKASWTWKFDKTAGEHKAKVTLHAAKALANNNSPWNIHTPLVEPDEDFAKSLAILHDEALAYVDGKRAQGRLPLDSEQDDNDS